MWAKGTKLVCIMEFASRATNSMLMTHIPLVGQIYTCDGYKSSGKIYLLGFNQAYIGIRISWDEHGFRPLDELLDEINISELLEEKVTA